MEESEKSSVPTKRELVSSNWEDCSMPMNCRFISRWIIKFIWLKISELQW
jgi:hypothetical protein